MGIFSEELKILDRNTVQLMIDEMQDTIDSQNVIIEELKRQLQKYQNEYEDKKRCRAGSVFYLQCQLPFNLTKVVCPHISHSYCMTQQIGCQTILFDLHKKIYYILSPITYVCNIILCKIKLYIFVDFYQIFHYNIMNSLVKMKQLSRSLFKYEATCCCDNCIIHEF